MHQRLPHVRTPASTKHSNNYFPIKPNSPNKQDLSYQYYMSDNPTPINQKKALRNFAQASNLISINNGVLNQVYYMQPSTLVHKYDTGGGNTLDQIWDRSGLQLQPTHQQQRRSSKVQNSTTINQGSNKQIMDSKQRTKAQNQLFQMLVNDISRRNCEQQNRRNDCKGKLNGYSVTTTSHHTNLGDKQRRVNNSLQKRLEETYQQKFQKTKPQHNSQNSQTNNWYSEVKKLTKNNINNTINMDNTQLQLPKKMDQSNKQRGISFNQTVPHKRAPSNYFNHSLEGQRTAEISFKNNVVKQGLDHSGYLQYQSDVSRNIIEDAHLSGQVMKCTGSYNHKALELLEVGKNHIRDKQLAAAINALQECINKDPTLLEGHYFLGIGYLGNLQFTKAIQEFQSIISQDQEYRKNVYLLIAISFKKINELDQAVAHLTRALQLFPRYYDALIYRGKIYIKQKQLEKALCDFQAAIQDCPQKGLGYLGKADCQRYGGNFQDAIKSYQIASQCEQTVSLAASLKKAITRFEAKQYDECVKDLNLLIENDPSNSEAYYFKGLCKLKGKSQEALLCFEQSIKHNNSKKAVTKSLYEIARIKIEQRDFYAAYHTLNRADFLDTEKAYLEKFRLFTEAVIFLMKRKFTESIQNFQLIQKNHSLNDFLKPLFYTYRAYGYFCISNHQKAFDDYKNLLDFVGQLDQGSIYNKLLCDGIIQVQSAQHGKGIELFEKASRIYPKKMEPLFYHGVTLVNQAFHSSIQNNYDKIQLILQGLQVIDQSQLLNESNANSFYIKAVIKAFLQNYGDAVQDIDKAIEKSEDNIPKYFYFRALIYGCSKQYKSAISDFSICINLDETYADAYLQRAKCEFIQGDSTQAFADLQMYISLYPDDPSIHVWAGSFLFANAALADAVKAYSHAPDLLKSEQLLTLRSQCYLLQSQLQNCLADVAQLLVITKDRKYQFDKNCIQSLMVVFRDTQEIYFDDEDESQSLELSKRLQQTTKLLSEQIIHKSFGKLFKHHHLYIFRGVCQFHLHNYEESLRDFQQALNLKEGFILNKREERSCNNNKDSLSQLFEINHEMEGELTEEEEDADLLEVLEIRFNELACLVMLKQLKKAKDKCRKLVENINENKQEGLLHLIMALEREIKKQEGKDYGQMDGEYDQTICLYDEPKENPLCFQVPIVNVSYLRNIKIRLSFSLPKISPPSLVPIYDSKLIQQISPLWVENKPEAPWIRRNDAIGDMIMFTDNLYMQDDIRLETEEEQDKEKDNKQIRKQDLYNLDNMEDCEPPIDRNAMKKNLMLDSGIEERLTKILEKRNNQQII